MLKILRTTLILSAALIPILGDRQLPAFSQEYQGCFMVDDFGQVIDLSEICPPPTQVVSNSESPELGTGDIQVTLRWATTDDLDLAVTDPTGNVVAYYNPAVPSGGQLDVDANAGCFSDPSQTPIENVFWPSSQAPDGSYTIEVNLFTRCTASNGPIPFEITLLVQGNTETITGTVDDQNQIFTRPFSLP
ncbi:MAG TPA: hypothetical protein ACFE0H_15485 [Elainellaceae cyanobacterium]